MEIEFSDGKISFKRVLSGLDEFVIDFCKILSEEKIKYAIVSGYIPIVFGRSRHTEDVDIITEKISKGKFELLWARLDKYTCINASDSMDAYSCLCDRIALRFTEGERFIPNVEFKFSPDDAGEYTLLNRIELSVNQNTLFISPLEMQVAYKLFFGSEKDIEDARFLFKLFRQHLNREKILDLAKKFNLKPSRSLKYIE